MTWRIPRTCLAVVALFVAAACSGDTNTAPEAQNGTASSVDLGDLVAQFAEAAHTCRAGFGDDIVTWRACKDSDKLRGEIARSVASGLAT